MELEVVKIDNKDYYIMKEVFYKDISYVFLSNKDDIDDILIRKSDKDNKDLLIPLKDEEEFTMACNLLFKDTEKRY